MVQCFSAFLDACYIARRNSITAPALRQLSTLIIKFQELRDIFVTTGVRESISLPRQHALQHFPQSIALFGSPNGLCSSITESKHIKAVKEPWRRSNRYEALIQMLTTIVRMEKMAALHRWLAEANLLRGLTSSSYQPASDADLSDGHTSTVHFASGRCLQTATATPCAEDDNDDGGPAAGTLTGAGLSSSDFDIHLAAKQRKS